MRRTFVAALLLAASLPGLALAQAKPEAAAPAAAGGVKRFGEFIVRCVTTKSVAPCDLYEERGNKTTGQRVIGFSVGFMPSTNRYIMQLVVPLGVAVDKGVIVTGGKFVSPAMPYRRCDSNGCYVEASVDKSLLDAFGKLGNDAKIKVTADGGKIYDFTFSFDGFNAAHDDMVAENRAKASANAADAQ